MKRIILSAVAVSIFAGAWAEGYQVNTLSAKQGGMAHTGVAQKLESESMFFNPAGMAFMDKTMSFSASVNALAPSVTAIIDGKKYSNATNVSTPFMATLGFSIYDNLKAGVAMYIPYGSSIDWGENWPGAVLNQNVNLKSYTIQPTISWRITPKFSVGAGLMMSWGNVDLNKGLIDAVTFGKMVSAQTGVPYTDNATPASVNINGTAQICWGANFGVLYDINKKWSVGASFRTEQKLKVKTGDATVSYSSELAQQLLGSRLNVINSQFKSSMPMPWVLSLGTTYRPIDKLKLAFDMQLTGWKAYKQLDIEFLSTEAAKYNQHIVKNYHNSFTFRLGGEYALTNRFDIRAGFIVDLPPVDKNRYNPETPAMTKLEPSAGFSFRPIQNLSIDLCVLYVHGTGVKNVKCTYEDKLAEMIPALGSPFKTLTADYKLHALSGALGISYSF